MIARIARWLRFALAIVEDLALGADIVLAAWWGFCPLQLRVLQLAAALGDHWRASHRPTATALVRITTDTNSKESSA